MVSVCRIRNRIYLYSLFRSYRSMVLPDADFHIQNRICLYSPFRNCRSTLPAALVLVLTAALAVPGQPAAVPW